MTYIGFHTGGVYKEVIETYLIPSLKRWNLKYKIYEKPNTHNWNHNTKYKPQVILEALTEFNDDIVIIDADAVINEFPKLFNEISEKCDIAAHLLDWFKFWRNQSGNPKRELLSGTMFFKNNNKVKNLIKEWITEMEKTDIIEQRILQQLLKKHSEIIFYNLPISYCIIPKQDNSFPDYVKKEKFIIQHFQFSRQIKRRIIKL